MGTSIYALVFLISASKALPLIDTGLGPPVAVLDTNQIEDFASLALDRVANLTKGVIQKIKTKSIGSICIPGWLNWEIIDISWQTTYFLLMWYQGSYALLWFLHSIQQSNFWAFCVTLFSARQLYDLLFHLNRQRWKRSLLFPVADFNKRALDQRLSDGSGQGWSTSSRQTNGNKII